MHVGQTKCVCAIFCIYSIHFRTSRCFYLFLVISCFAVCMFFFIFFPANYNYLQKRLYHQSLFFIFILGVFRKCHLRFSFGTFYLVLVHCIHIGSDMYHEWEANGCQQKHYTAISMGKETKEDNRGNGWTM